MTAQAICKKYGIKPNKSKRANDKVAERASEIVREEIAKDVAKGPSRNDLMLQAKAKGIKNFRILNKAELTEILGGCDDLRAQAITIDAVNRWKSGFGKGKKKVKDENAI